MHNNVFLANFEAMEKNEIIIPDTYRSISGESEGLFKDNGSRFIAKAYPVESEEEVKMIVGSLKKEYHDARHHCYAYRLGYRGDVFRANDDGEPSSSAGLRFSDRLIPIASVIYSLSSSAISAESSWVFPA